MKKHLAGLMALALMASGCVSMEHGKPLAKDSLSRIQKGRTTKQEVEAMYGKPQSTSLNMDGSETLAYSYGSVTGKASPMAFIPIVGLFAKSKGESQTQSLQILIKDNVVSNYSYSETGAETESSLMGTKTKSR